MRQEKDDMFWTKSNTSIVSESKPFSEGISYVLQKGQKLSAAVHLVTDHLSLNEPLRTSLRTSSVSLLSVFSGLFAGNPGEAQRGDELLISLISYLTVAEGSRIISPANVAVLRSEYDSLRQLLRQVSSVDRSSIAPESFATSRPLKQKLLIQGHLPISRRKKDISIGHVGHSPVGSTSAPKEDRRRIILDLLAATPKITIRNLVSAISGVSEKTLQRELIALVQEGVLKKEGERRWSSYSLSLSETEKALATAPVQVIDEPQV